MLAAKTFDAFASWPLTKRLQVVARRENLTNVLVMVGINGDGSVERDATDTVDRSALTMIMDKRSLDQSGLGRVRGNYD